MNVFVLCTGRCGSVTFSKACEHITNYTSGHESRYRLLGDDRLKYPRRHIEVDPRLAWYLGPLGKAHASAFYVHLVRDPDKVASSYLRKFERGSRNVSGFWYGLLGKPSIPTVEIMTDMVAVMNANIEEYLRDKRHIRIEIEDAKRAFPLFCSGIGASADLAAACAEFDIHHNLGE